MLTEETDAMMRVMTGQSDLLERAARLGDRVNGHPEHAAEIVPELTAMLGATRDPKVLAAVVRSLGAAWTSEASLAVLAFAEHPDDSVRLEVTHALAPGEESGPDALRVADALIGLSADSNDDVRDWATFGLGSMLDVDAAGVRAALVARLDDPVGDVRDEALIGLARRRDPRALALVSARLLEAQVGALVFGAAAFLADATVVPSLRDWNVALPGDDEITRALDACDPDRQRQRLQHHEEFLSVLQDTLDHDRPGEHAALWCERMEVAEVLLGVGGHELVWWVDSLLTRAGDDPALAVGLVLEDLGT